MYTYHVCVFTCLLEFLLFSPLLAHAEKATNPKNRYEDWEFIMAFCDKVNGEPEG